MIPRAWPISWRPTSSLRMWAPWRCGSIVIPGLGAANRRRLLTHPITQRAPAKLRIVKKYGSPSNKECGSCPPQSTPPGKRPGNQNAIIARTAPPAICSPISVSVSGLRHRALSSCHPCPRYDNPAWFRLRRLRVGKNIAGCGSSCGVPKPCCDFAPRSTDRAGLDRVGHCAPESPRQSRVSRELGAMPHPTVRHSDCHQEYQRRHNSERAAHPRADKPPMLHEPCELPGERCRGRSPSALLLVGMIPKIVKGPVRQQHRRRRRATTSCQSATPARRAQQKRPIKCERRLHREARACRDGFHSVSSGAIVEQQARPGCSATLTYDRGTGKQRPRLIKASCPASNERSSSGYLSSPSVADDKSPAGLRAGHLPRSTACRKSSILGPIIFVSGVLQVDGVAAVRHHHPRPADEIIIFFMRMAGPPGQAQFLGRPS